MNLSSFILISCLTALCILPFSVHCVPLMRTQHLYTNFDTNPYLQDSYIFPHTPVSATNSSAKPRAELKSWAPLTIFEALLELQYPEIIDLLSDGMLGQSLFIFAPTNEAFLRLFHDITSFMISRASTAQLGESLMTFPFEQCPDLMEQVVKTHFIKGDWTEHSIKQIGTIESLSGATLNTTTYPNITIGGFPNASASRVFRPIETRGEHVVRIAFIDNVLLPKPLHDLLESTHETGENLEMGNRSERVKPSSSCHSKPIVGINGQEIDWGYCLNMSEPWIEKFGSLLNYTMPLKISTGNFTNSSKLDVPLSYVNGSDTFKSTISFLENRMDCSIFQGLLSALPGVQEMIENSHQPVHLFVPVDESFVQSMSSNWFILEHFKHDAVPDLQKIVKTLVLKLKAIWASRDDLPPLANLILHYFTYGSAQPVHLLNGSSIPSLSGGRIRVSTDGSYIEDVDYPTGPAYVIASYATKGGFVTPVSGLVTNYDTSLSDMIDQAFNSAWNVLDLENHKVMGTAGPTPSMDEEEGEMNVPSADPDYGERQNAGACFPGDAELILSTGQLIDMRDLQGGHLIKVSGSGLNSRVIAFSHRERSRAHPFLEISFTNGQTLTLSEGHYTYVRGSLLAASAVSLGDTMMNGTGKLITVSHIRKVWKTGKYAPHTMHGDLVVDGVVVSAYTTEVHPSIAHALLTPVRMISAVSGVREPLGAILYGGLGHVIGKSIIRGRTSYN